jgi:hypothetical protein
VTELSVEDQKLLTLARTVRARTGAEEGAAVRDGIGRSYSAASVALPSLTLTALQAAVAAAISSGSTTFEAAVLVTPSAPDVRNVDRAVLNDVGEPPLHVFAP